MFRNRIDSDISESDSEDEDIFYLQVNERLPRIRFAPERPEIFDGMTDSNFRNRFRFSKEAVLKIMEMIEVDIQPRGRGNRANSAINKFLLTLRCYASGTFQAVYGDLFNVHRTTAGRIVKQVTDAICKLRSRFIKMPETILDLQSSMTKFYNMIDPHGIPGVIGLIDCTHIRIISPGNKKNPQF